MNTDALIAALRPLAGIPFEDYHAIHDKPDAILMMWNGHTLTVKHVLDARAAISQAEAA